MRLNVSGDVTVLAAEPFRHGLIFFWTYNYTFDLVFLKDEFCSCAVTIRGGVTTHLAHAIICSLREVKRKEPHSTSRSRPRGGLVAVNAQEVMRSRNGRMRTKRHVAQSKGQCRCHIAKSKTKKAVSVKFRSYQFPRLSVETRRQPQSC